MNQELKKHLIVLAGPTASGKTAAAIELARHFETTIISSDSRQFFKEMSIGTAKPDAGELAAAPHYFINSHTLTQSFSVGDFEREALQLLNGLFQQHSIVIMAGGSGLYIKAVCEGFDDLPTADIRIREKLNKQLADKGVTSLQQMLKNIDPAYYAAIDIHNPQRIIRAIEVFESTGKTFSSYLTASARPRPFHIIKLGLDMPREKLYERINRRVDIMIAQGLVEEAKALVPYRHVNALNTVGYTELFNYFDGKTDLATAIALIKQNTRRFAKRQLTWFRKDKEIIWIDAAHENMNENLLAEINKQIKIY